MFRTSSYVSNNQIMTYRDKISVIVLFLFILSILIALVIILLSPLIELPPFEFFKGFNLFINIWALGFLINDILFTKDSTDSKNNDVNGTETYFNSKQSLFRYIILPIAFGIITSSFLGLVAIILSNILKIYNIAQRILILFSVFYLSELSLIVIYLFSNRTSFKSLLIQLKFSLKQLKHLDNLKNHLPSYRPSKSYPLIVMSILSFTILIISLILGEINYNFGILNILLVYLFFLAIIFLLIFFLRLKNRTPYIDVILIFLLAFSLAHLFISRGPTIVGRTDINGEFFSAQHALTTMNWDPSEFETNLNTIVSISIFPMVLSVVFGIKLETFFELVNPLIFGFFNIAIYLILRRIHSKYNFNSSSKDIKIQDSSPYSVLFSVLILIFIRSYTHVIAASARIVIAYFLFSTICLLIIDDKLASKLKRSQILFILLTFVFLSHYGTFLFGIAVIITSFIVFMFYLSLKKYHLLLNYSELINRENIQKILYNGFFIGVFGALSIIWFFFIAPQVMNVLQGRIIPAVENSFNNGIDELIPQIISLLSRYRIINFSNPIIFFEATINLSICLIIILSNLMKIIRVFQFEDVNLSDFFGISFLFIIGLMFLIPVLSSFNSPIRVGMQFWPFIAPIFFYKIRLNRIISLRSHFPTFLRKMFSIKMSSMMTIFLFLLLSFHQGIIYDIVYNGDSSRSSEVVGVGESLSLVFGNYGVEARRWVLTESDLQAIEWLNSQSPVLIYADLSRTSMLLSRINSSSVKGSRIQISTYALHRFFKTNSTNFFQRNSYIFFSSQNIESGAMFFSNKPSNTYRLISQLIELNAVLVYNNRTQIYYLPYQ